MKLNLLTLFFILSLNYGCSINHPLMLGSADGPVFEELPRDPSKSIIYLYRPPHIASGGAAPIVYINGMKTVLMKNDGYTVIKIDPGLQKIRTVHSPWWCCGYEDYREISTKGGMSYYIKINTVAGWGRSDFLIEPIVEQLGLLEIKDRAYIEPNTEDN